MPSPFPLLNHLSYRGLVDAFQPVRISVHQGSVAEDVDQAWDALRGIEDATHTLGSEEIGVVPACHMQPVADVLGGLIPGPGF